VCAALELAFDSEKNRANLNARVKIRSGAVHVVFTKLWHGFFWSSRSNETDGGLVGLFSSERRGECLLRRPNK
jgi:hypothetical protein